MSGRDAALRPADSALAAPAPRERVVSATQSKRELSKPLHNNNFPGSSGNEEKPALSQLIRDIAHWNRPARARERADWRRGHVVDKHLQRVFSEAAEAIAARNIALHARSYRINALLTLNSGALGVASSDSYIEIEKALIQRLRNGFRGRAHRFAGFWRREVAGGELKGVHVHIATHLPRGMRSTLLERLPKWLGDPIDFERSSPRFQRPNWRVVSSDQTWHLCRVYDVDNLVDYLSKMPSARDGLPFSRERRRSALISGSREFATFGLGDLESG